MKFYICETFGQVYILPYVKLTYTRELNDNLEFIIGWLKWEVVLGV